MNHLAHIYLSFESEELLFGNFLADFLSLKEKRQLPESKLAGIRLHNWIDQYTDNHPVVMGWKRKMYPEFGKYSPVLTDILMDHQLAIHWPLLHEDTFDVFCHKAYISIEQFMPHVSIELQKRLEGMIKASWLHTFQDIAGLSETLRLLALRARFSDDFSGLIGFYIENKQEFDTGFMEFFPELTAYAGLRMAELSPQNED